MLKAYFKVRLGTKYVQHFKYWDNKLVLNLSNLHYWNWDMSNRNSFVR